MRKKLTALAVSKRARSIAGVAILAISVCFFVAYAAHHPEIIRHVITLQPLEIIGILGLYFVFLGATTSILLVNVRMCRAIIGRKESLLLTIYSTIVNFFGPLQSGPGFRAIYLKKKYDIKLRTYGAATLYYYLFFALFSAIFLLQGFLAPIVAIVAICLLIGAAIAFIVWRRHTGKKLPSGSPRLFLQLGLATLLQVAVVAMIYFIELRSIDDSITLQQAVTYAGAANFALFVSLTPGSIGIRESFLLFSQQLHGIDSQTVIAASVIDRAFYFVFLGILFVLATSVHARDRLHSR